MGAGNTLNCCESESPRLTRTGRLPCAVIAAHVIEGGLIFRLSHLAFSNWTGRFASFDAKLMLDSKNPANSHVEATIDPNSLASDNPPLGFLDMLHGAEWLNAGAFPQITFQSTKIVMTAPNKADVTGDLTLHGVTN
jgi:polyisoprenoid-binding protein YceI